MSRVRVFSQFPKRYWLLLVVIQIVVNFRAPTTASAHKPQLLMIVQAEAAIIHTEVRFWHHEHKVVQLRIGDCTHHSTSKVRCLIEYGAVFVNICEDGKCVPGPFQWIAGEDEAVLRGSAVRVRVVPSG